MCQNTLKAYQDTIGLYLQFLEEKGIGCRNLDASCFGKYRIASRMGRRDLTLILMLCSTAARIDEILSMKAGQLHLDVVKPYVGIAGKENKIRTLYLLPRTAAHLKKYLHEFHGDAPCAEALATLEGDNDSKTEK